MYPSDAMRIIRMVGLDAIGTSLVELGFPTDAVPLFREALGLSDGVDTILLSALLPSFTDSPRQVGEHLNAAIDGLKGSELAPVAGRSIALAAGRPAGGSAGGPGLKSIHDRGGQAVDLMTIVHPRNLDSAAVRSLFADSIVACDQLEHAQLEKPLESLRQAHPDDLSVAIASTIEAFMSPDAERAERHWNGSPISSKRRRSTRSPMA